MCVGTHNEWTLLYVNQFHLCVRGTHSVSLRLFSQMEFQHTYEFSHLIRIKLSHCARAVILEP